MQLLDRTPLRTLVGWRIGLAVTPEKVGAVLVRGSSPMCSALETIGADETLTTAVQRALQQVFGSNCPPRLRPTVSVAIDTPYSRVKTIRGVPEVTDARVVARLLAATPERFFLGSGRLITTGARIVEPGVVQSVAFDATMLEEIESACAALGLQTTLFVVAAAARASAPSEEDDSEMDLTLTAALGATRVARSEPFAVRGVRAASPSNPKRRGRLIAAGIAAFVSIVIATFTPPLLAIYSGRQARRTIAALAPSRARAMVTERQVAAMTATITSVESFERRRVSKTLLLSQLTQSLPSSAVITTLTVDTTGITIVVIAPKAADVVRGVGEMLGVSHVKLLGPVTHEAMSPTGGTPSGSAPVSAVAGDMERVTVQLQVAADGSNARVPLGYKE